MMIQEKKIQMVKMLIYFFIWAILLVFPILTQGRDGTVIWNRVYSEWIRLLPFLLIFLLHHFLLLPLLLSGKYMKYYLIGTILLLILISVLSPNLRFLNNLIHQLSPPDMNPIGPVNDPLLGPPPRQIPVGQPGQANGVFHPMVYYNLIISVFLVGFDAAISMVSKLFKQEQQAKEIERSKLETELAFLRNQISPHFFMNTLNNIHALIEEDQVKAQDAVIRLSKLMRYLLYETQDGKVRLAKEIEFLSSYFDLMRMRFDHKVDIELEVPTEIPELSLPPLLCISFVENAFKHGISYRSKSFVKMNLALNSGYLEYRISNSIPEGPEKVSNTEVQEMSKTNSGIGLENVKKQLSMLYGNNFELLLSSEDSVFFVYLKIPIAND